MTERNAEPELVSLAILDVCERAAREFPADYANVIDKDAQFMMGALANWQSRIKVLKLQAAAGWKPRFQAMLDQAHSICIEEISYPEKEAVRTKKMRCMACGRWEKRCKYGLNAVGTFPADDFNCKGASQLMPAWNDFRLNYEQTLSYDVESGKLHPNDMGLHSIGETCMRKAQVYYQLNTLLLNEVFEAYYKAQGEDLLGNEWVHASEKQAQVFLERFQYLQACAADEKRSVPSWGTDKVLWEKVEQARCDAAQGNEALMGKLLRKRAESFVGVCESEDSGSDAEPEITRASGTRKRPSVLEESEESEESGSESESDGLDEFIVEDAEEAEPNARRCPEERVPARRRKRSCPSSSAPAAPPAPALPAPTANPVAHAALPAPVQARLQQLFEEGDQSYKIGLRCAVGLCVSDDTIYAQLALKPDPHNRLPDQRAKAMGCKGYTTVFNHPVYQLLQRQFLQITQAHTRQKWPDGNGEKQIILQGIRTGVRKSRRVMGRSPESTIAAPSYGAVSISDEEFGEEPGGPYEELDRLNAERDEEPGGPPVRPSRAPPPDPFRVAQARRGPQGGLPARRECLLQLGELQLQLIREGRDGDASVCTNAIMTLQELMTRVEQLAHTA
jgi:hypothetical protein